MTRSKLLLLGLGMALITLFAATPASAQDAPAITVEPTSVDAAGEATFTVNGTGWTAAPPIFVLPCPVPESGVLEDLSADQCDTTNLTPATPEGGAFSVEVTYDVPAEGIVVAAGDAAQTESAAALIRVGTSDGGEAGSIAEVAEGAGGFTTLLLAADAAGLAGTLADCAAGPFTVLAPTDDAFAAALDALGLTAEELLADTALLTSVLTYHVLDGTVPAADVIALDGQDVATLNGATVAISVDGDTVMVNDATVVATDVIDSVLLPPAGDATDDTATDDTATDDTADDTATDDTATDDTAEDTADDTALAQTGSETGPIALVGIGFVLLGAAALAARRRLTAG